MTHPICPQFLQSQGAVEELTEVPNFFREVLGDAFQCFGCAAGNKSSLQGRFYSFTPPANRGEVLGFFPAVGGQHTSFPQMVHGGILSTMIDDSAYWTLFHHIRRLGVTSEMQVRYLAPCNERTSIITVSTLDPETPSTPQIGHKITVHVKLYHETKGTAIAQGKVVFVLLPSEKLIQLMGSGAQELINKL